ncbi:hypothetical protein [Acuticoccus mangrovi]|uniref:Uncharacterized protein n=1 Tax=Acuticoccus mangrovi TaxID=2796142 RepID=A0A934MF94_9HYPH|nr:hypothetical protein [Acuticoccus mangrovi]MBJ3778422.1 hypothetical protein [Acuticoccus mangrovi]
MPEPRSPHDGGSVATLMVGAATAGHPSTTLVAEGTARAFLARAGMVRAIVGAPAGRRAEAV